MAKPMLGGEVAEHLKPQIARYAEEVRQHGNPGVAAVYAGSNPASEIYLRKKREMCEELGFHFELCTVGEDVDVAYLTGLISELNQDRKFHGILVQLPLPAAVEDNSEKHKILDAIDPRKDVDALSSGNALEIYRGGIGYFIPATVRAVLEMMRYYGIETEGKRAVVIGRNDITGKPFQLIFGGRAGASFAEKLGNATVTWCHRYTADSDLTEYVRGADIVIACAGINPRELGRDYLITEAKDGAAVFDVATRMEGNRVLGDVDGARTKNAGYLTPVPGGVGPMTVMALMQNLVDAAYYANGMDKRSYDLSRAKV